MLGAEVLICRRADAVISVSARDLADLRRRLLLNHGIGSHIPNGVALTSHATKNRAKTRSDLGIRPNDFVVGTVARLVPQKGIADLIDAAMAPGEFKVIIVGDGELRLELEDRARPGGERVRFLGLRDDVPRLLSALDAFVLPSRWEGEPIALLEAMAAGLPCVATRTSGAVELLTDGSSGLLVPIADPAALAAAIRRLQSSPTLRRSLARTARRAVEGRSWDLVARNVELVYRGLISGSSPA
jgi:glycosyltransferase involved in cell wall biosynthesis